MVTILKMSFFVILIILLAVLAIMPVFIAGRYLSGTPWVFIIVMLSVFIWWPLLTAFYVYFSKRFLID